MNGNAEEGSPPFPLVFLGLASGMIPLSIFRQWEETGCARPDPPQDCGGIMKQMVAMVGDYDPDNLFTDLDLGNATLGVCCAVCALLCWCVLCVLCVLCCVLCVTVCFALTPHQHTTLLRFCSALLLLIRPYQKKALAPLCPRMRRCMHCAMRG